MRQNLVEETGKMHMQNEELKTLLKQYLQANINQELIVPPTDVIRYDADEVWYRKNNHNENENENGMGKG